MSPNRIERWKHLEASLSSLLSSMTCQLDPASYELAKEFIEHREYGVALEWLAEAAAKQGIRLSESQQADFDQLARVMGIDLSR